MAGGSPMSSIQCVKEIVYISGPMSSSGEPGTNLNRAALAAAMLMDAGFLPFVPHLSWIQHAITPWVPLERLKETTLSWVDRSDALLRLHGDSEGADGEVLRAVSLGIPVFYSVHHLMLRFRVSGKGGDAMA